MKADEIALLTARLERGKSLLEGAEGNRHLRSALQLVAAAGSNGQPLTLTQKQTGALCAFLDFEDAQNVIRKRRAAIAAKNVPPDNVVRFPGVSCG